MVRASNAHQACGFITALATVAASSFALFLPPTTPLSLSLAAILYVYGASFSIVYSIMRSLSLSGSNEGGTNGEIVKGALKGFLLGPPVYLISAFVALLNSEPVLLTPILGLAFSSISFGTAFLMCGLLVRDYTAQTLRRNHAFKTNRYFLRQSIAPFYVSLLSGNLKLMWDIRASDLWIAIIAGFLAGWLSLARRFSPLLIIPGVVLLAALLGLLG